MKFLTPPEIWTKRSPRLLNMAGVEFHPIQLDSLVIDTVLEFELHSKTANEAFVLFRGRDQEFGSRHRDGLLSHGIHTLYVSEEDQGQYGRYIEQNIGGLATDPTVSPLKKAELLYSVSKGVLLDAFANPRSTDLVKRVEKVMPHMVDLIVQGKEALASMISIMSYDYYTFTHSINVSTFTVALANEAGVVNRQELYDLGTGALLHDIGKSEIPKEILNKTGPLTAEEMEVMKSHVIRGEKLLGMKEGMSPSRMLPVSLHHEKLSGRGYPRALKAEQIHLHGRITAISDCFDAMTTHRPYALGMNAYQAVQLMKGKLQDDFDQELVSSFIVLLGSAR
jgi:HD-GYP domain-containing protein (c-di-GMP phosphodiesterase class II)